MKKIVVFGASGDVWRYFIDYLLTRKAEYQIVAVGHRKHFSIFKNCPSVQYYSMDITLEVWRKWYEEDSCHAVVYAPV